MTDRDPDALAALNREREVAKYLGRLGGELISKCQGHDFAGERPCIVVTRRGVPLADLVRDGERWPPSAEVSQKIITDLLQGLEILRRTGIVHRRIGLHSLHWDGTTLQLSDFGAAALSGEAPDGSPAEHAEDVYAAALVIYRVHTGDAPPEDPVELRRSIEDLYHPYLTTLLIGRARATVPEDYAFAEEPDLRPPSSVLLDRHLALTRRKDRREERLAEQEAAARRDFAELRRRQRRFREIYDPWAARTQPPRPRLEPVIASHVQSPPPYAPGNEPGLPAWARPGTAAVAVVVVLLVILLLAVSR